ncbi:hypothetical protein BJ508DRAFT_336889 [Ascobolus immersus RN42]|uniref:DUF6532 domain-containing protein n=1 Tax=Ascobolus immersus RN42 TaxID=1160509 RepID=A0A3N4H9S4_ASCIM|nr:hypothetical protein BJ508DRAFT_336889 [Ascobolus immersus RN42]
MSASTDQVDIFVDARETQAASSQEGSAIMEQLGLSGILQNSSTATGQPTLRRTQSTSGLSNMTQSLLNGRPGFTKAVGTNTSFGKVEKKKSKAPKAPSKRAMTEVPGYVKQKDLPPHVFATYKKLKFKLMEIIYKEYPYKSFAEVGKRMKEHWVEHLKATGKTLEQIPFNWQVSSAYQKEYARLKSKLLSEAVKVIDSYYGISTVDANTGLLDQAEIQALQADNKYTFLNHKGNEPEDKLRFYNPAIARLANNFIIDKRGVTKEMFQSWVCPNMIAFLFTILYFALKKREPENDKIQIENHQAKPIFDKLLTSFKLHYPDAFMQQNVIATFLENLAVVPMVVDDLPKPALPDDGLSIEERRRIQQSMFQKRFAKSHQEFLSARASQTGHEGPGAPPVPVDHSASATQSSVGQEGTSSTTQVSAEAAATQHPGTAQEHPVPAPTAEELAAPAAQEHPVAAPAVEEHPVGAPTAQEHLVTAPAAQEDPVAAPAAQEDPVAAPDVPNPPLIQQDVDMDAQMPDFRQPTDSVQQVPSIPSHSVHANGVSTPVQPTASDAPASSGMDDAQLSNAVQGDLSMAQTDLQQPPLVAPHQQHPVVNNDGEMSNVLCSSHEECTSMVDPSEASSSAAPGIVRRHSKRAAAVAASDGIKTSWAAMGHRVIGA